MIKFFRLKRLKKLKKNIQFLIEYLNSILLKMTQIVNFILYF